MINKPYYDIDISSNQWIIESLRSYSDSEMPTAPCRSRWFRVRTAGHRNCSCGYHCILYWLLYCYYYYYAIIIIIIIIITIWYYIYIYTILYTNVPMIITQWHECSLIQKTCASLRQWTSRICHHQAPQRRTRRSWTTMTILETSWGLSLPSGNLT